MISVGAWVIFLVAVVSSVVVMMWPLPKREGMELWTFARLHTQMYQPVMAEWNAAADHGHPPVHGFTIDYVALSRRALSAFWANTPVADLIEIETGMASQFFAGPVGEIGFLDLTDKIKAEGLDRKINPPSFSAWTSRGRVFGLPHDVHPVLLVYRADLVEDAGIDVGRIETWADFAREMRPLIQDLDDDGTADRYLLSFWYTSVPDIETLLYQAGGGTFRTNPQTGGDELIVACEENAWVVANVVSWCVGPTRIAIDSPEFTASGNQLKLDGRVVAALMPDWLAGVWKNDLPQLGGKLKLMPLPAWRPGGRRTSVRGGTMIGIPRTGADAEAAWAFAKHLYLSEQLAEKLFETNHIVSPNTDLWDRPYYHQPDPYFSGQLSGELYITQAPHVPTRISSPFHSIALTRIAEAVNALRRYALENEVYEAGQLLPEARRLLAKSQADVEREMRRNVFVGGPR